MAAAVFGRLPGLPTAPPSPEQRVALESAAAVPVPAPPAETLARLVDLKGPAKLEHFNGQEPHRGSWKFRFANIMGLWGLDNLFAMAEREAVFTEARIGPDMQQKSKLLWTLLAQLCHGKAFALVRLCERNQGFAAWRRLHEEYDQPQQMSRHLSVLTGLLQPAFPAAPQALADATLELEWRCGEFHGQLRLPTARAGAARCDPGARS